MGCFVCLMGKPGQMRSCHMGQLALGQFGARKHDDAVTRVYFLVSESCSTRLCASKCLEHIENGRFVEVEPCRELRDPECRRLGVNCSRSVNALSSDFMRALLPGPCCPVPCLSHHLIRED